MMLRMGEVLSYGVMALTIMESIRMARNMAEAFTTGLMDLNMEETGNKMKCMVRENSYGLMVGNTRVNFKWE
jgi:hypothetical protein